MNMRFLVFLAVLLASVFVASAAGVPNILWIISDDLSPDLGCYGYEGVDTPNIDALAAQGVRFEAAFATAPVCSSSRSALITGRYQSSIGAHHHRTMGKQPLPEGVLPVTHYLREAGYQCVNLKGLGAKPKTDYNFTTDTPVFDGGELDPEKPFFLQVCFFEPHRPFKLKGDPRPDAVIPPQYPEHPVVRSDWSAYLEAIEVLDRKVGGILKWLDETGQADNTVVFFFGDHGRPHVWDKQWLYEGGIRVPLIVRHPGRNGGGTVDRSLVSLIDVSAETLRIAGCELPDGLDGIPFLNEGDPRRTEIFAARDRCGDAYDRVRCVRTGQFKYIRNFYPELPYWHTSRYKETGYPALEVMKQLFTKGELNPAQARFFADRKPEEELYDLKADPDELVNLAGDPAHAGTLNDLRRRLKDWIEKSGDQGAVPETMENYDSAVSGSARHFRKFRPDAWHRRSEVIRAELIKRGLKPLKE